MTRLFASETTERTQFIFFQTSFVTFLGLLRSWESIPSQKYNSLNIKMSLWWHLQISEVTLNQLEVLSLSSQDPEGYKMLNTECVGETECRLARWIMMIIYNVDHVSVKSEMMG